MPPTQFFCSLSREAVSPGPFSGRANGGEGCGLGGREQGRVVPAPVPVPREEGDVWGKGVRLQGGGVGWGRDWVDLVPEEGALVWDSWVRPVGGVG